ncbi:sulfur carrier protein [Scopulibacillus daqui]|uniref:Sulfur carrier protein n=1 Tax=Scopulibacillus daqui TaxID=1469162 RepID=A0ABS2PYP5_9BACL|nr:sulfur carrier protein ThiS [Scopulibacillus daqui]MBM7645086.1 sulfur carrier protein [Scopulibacillus daqui]
MKVRVNGKSIDLPDDILTIEQLLSHFHLENKLAIVEKNKEIIDRKTYKTRTINEGDQIEIVHFVGGG